MNDESCSTLSYRDAETRSPPKAMLATPEWRGQERRVGHRDSPLRMSLVLDEIDYGVVLLDSRLHVVHANRAALAELKTGRSLVVSGSELTAVHPRDKTILGAAIRAAAVQHLRRLVMLGGSADRVAVAVVPLAHAIGGTESGVLLLLSRQTLCESLSAAGFARSHGLTSAEGRVLLALCQGLNAAEIAAIQGVALSTVRTQIFSIRAKTDAASIGELVQRVAKLPPLLNVLRSETRMEAA